MILYPAIDLKDGAAVRLVQGEMDRATVFSHDPAAIARGFAAAGATWLHLVDLNGAFVGRPANAAAVASILECRAAALPIGRRNPRPGHDRGLAGEGHRTGDPGPVAVENPDLVREAARAYPGQIAVGIDARNGRVAVRGWAEETGIDATAAGQIL